MELKLFNTETRKKETIKPQSNNCFLLYTCGPTVYDYAHIGNFRTYVFEDLLRRTILFLGYDVKQVMNITDVDDKTIRGAKNNNITLEEYTKPFIEAFFEDLKILHIQKAEFFPKATDYIPHMIKIIQALLDKQIAYVGADGSVYFSIAKFPTYGRLSHLQLDELKKGASNRVLLDEYDKETASDFVLWKIYDLDRDGAIYWDSPFGKGRPGWHIECSAMGLEVLGTTIDLHCGGVDNIFPHHENEIAQSECYTGKQFVKTWAHSQHLIVDNKKMSKSLGNFYTLRSLLEKGFKGSEIRYLLMQTHYRSQLNFTLEGLKAAANSLTRISDFIIRLRQVGCIKSQTHIFTLLEEAKKQFTQALCDDLNISAALAVIFDLIRQINTLLDNDFLSTDDAKSVLSLLEKFNEVLGVIPLQQEDEAPEEIQEALKQRELARKEKEFAKADQLRDFIQEKGYRIEDTPSGAVVKKNN